MHSNNKTTVTHCPSCNRSFLQTSRFSIFALHVCKKPHKVTRKIIVVEPRALSSIDEGVTRRARVCIFCGKALGPPFFRVVSLCDACRDAYRLEREAQWREQGYPACTDCRLQLDHHHPFCFRCMERRKEEALSRELWLHIAQVRADRLQAFYQLCVPCHRSLREILYDRAESRDALLKVASRCPKDGPTVREFYPYHFLNRSMKVTHPRTSESYHDALVGAIARWITHASNRRLKARSEVLLANRVVDVAVWERRELLHIVEVVCFSSPQWEAGKVADLADTGAQVLAFVSHNAAKLRRLRALIGRSCLVPDHLEVLYASPLEYLRCLKRQHINLGSFK